MKKRETKPKKARFRFRFVHLLKRHSRFPNSERGERSSLEEKAAAAMTITKSMTTTQVCTAVAVAVAQSAPAVSECW